MIHIIQNNLFKEIHYNLLIETLDKISKIDDSVSYHIVRSFPFVDKLVEEKDYPKSGESFNVDDLKDFDLNKNEKVFLWGSIKLGKIAKDRGWKPAILLNDNHDYLVYSRWWKNNLLNYDSTIYNIEDDLPWSIGKLFLRPIKDNKAFTGDVFDEETWEATKKMYLDNSSYTNFKRQEKIQVAVPKKIYKEIRFWIVNGKIITGSYYRLNKKSYLSNDIEQDAFDFANEIINLGQLADAWVLDVCLTDKGWKVVEAGCINHAGFYASEIDKTVMEIEHFYK